jgi:hypothetical protein
MEKDLPVPTHSRSRWGCGEEVNPNQNRGFGYSSTGQFNLYIEVVFANYNDGRLVCGPLYMSSYSPVRRERERERKKERKKEIGSWRSGLEPAQGHSYLLL